MPPIPEDRDLPENVVVLYAMDRAMRRRGPGADVEALAEEAGIEASVIRGHFPGGQQAVYDAVISSTCDEFDDVVTRPMLSAPDPREALYEAADGLDAYYEGGARHCLFELFSVPEDAPHGPVIKDQAARFLDALTTVFRRMNKDEAAARARAHRLFAELQGTLVLSRMTNEPELFRAFTESLRRAR